MRSGGGLGEFSMGSTQASVAASCERLGKSDATWPSGPSPSRITSKTGSPTRHSTPHHSHITLDIATSPLAVIVSKVGALMQEREE